MTGLIQDLRYAARMLRKSPGMTAAAVVTLALGIGANTAIFTVVNAVLLRPLPYPQAERLMQIGRSFGKSGVNLVSEPKFIFWRDLNQSFDAMAAIRGSPGLNLSGAGEPEHLTDIRVSADFFRVLGVSPTLGRGFTREEDSPAGERVVVLSDGLWRHRFGSNAGLIGGRLTLNGASHTVVGIMSPDFKYVWPFDVLIPLRLDPASRSGAHNFEVLGRLKPGVTETKACEEMTLVGEKFRAAYPRAMNDNEGVNLIGWQSNLVQESRRLLWILLGAVSFVLLIACANVAHLQLTRSAGRRREMAVRLAMGASASRLGRQLLIEGVLLALIGAGAGLLLGLWGTDALIALLPESLIPRVSKISLDWYVLAFTLAAAILTGLIFSLAPALQAARVDVNQSMKEGLGGGTIAETRGRLRGVLMVGEIALSLVLLIGATLLVRTFFNLRSVDVGFDPHQLVTFQVSLTGTRYDTTAKVTDFHRRALESLRGLPGVEAAAITNTIPLEAQWNLPYALADGSLRGAVQYRMVTPDFFRVMKMPVRQGRSFAEADGAGAEPVVIVNQAFARQNFPGTNSLGQRLSVGRGFGDPALRSIIGVANDAKQFGLGAPSPPTVYVPAAQVPDELMIMLQQATPTHFVIRSAAKPLQLTAAVKRDLSKFDSDLPVKNVRSMEQVLEGVIVPDRFNMTLLGLFAAIGLLLAAIGVYGVMSYTVAQRTREIGIRMALGAEADAVLKLVIGRGVLLASIGVAIGLIGAWGLTRLMKNLLYGVSPTDPFIFVGIALMLTVVVVLACWLPARRAAKVDPMVALRYE